MKNSSTAAIPQLECNYSTISPKELMLKVLPDYQIDNPLECRLWERGANDTYQVLCSDSCYFLRIYRHDAYSLEAVEFEAEFLQYLHTHGCSVAYPIARKSGGFITEIGAFEGSRFVLVTALAPGKEPEYDLLENGRLVGRALAQMHKSAEGFTSSRMRAHLDLDKLLDHSLAIIRGYIHDQPEQISLIEQVASEVRTAVASVPENFLDIGVCHGDFHGGNLHLHEGEIVIFDFEECAFGYRLCDLGTFKWGVCDGDDGAALWAAFIDGYTSIRAISEQSLALVDQFVKVRTISETAYGIRHVGFFGGNDIMASDMDHICRQLQK